VGVLLVVAAATKHGDRLLTSVATLAFIWLACELGLRGETREQRRWLRHLGTLALGAVCLQGLLGGLTVHYLLPMPVSVAHACLAQAFLCLMIVLAVCTSPSWIAAEPRLQADAAWPLPAGGLWKLYALSAGVVYLQLVLGAVMRHLEAGLAIPDFPLAFGKLVPPLSSFEIAIHYSHRLGALAVCLCIVATALRTLKHGLAQPQLKALAALMVLAVAAQITLGAYTIWSRKQPLLTSLHVVTGAAILGLCVLGALRSYQTLGRQARQPAGPAQSTGALSTSA
jgi:cytochrome c oxidase assembly protein subunit 15